MHSQIIRAILFLFWIFGKSGIELTHDAISGDNRHDEDAGSGFARDNRRI